MMKTRVNPALIISSISLLLSLIEFLGVRAAGTSNGIRITRLTESFALTAVGFLYAFVISFPLLDLFPSLAKNPYIKPVIKGLGLSALYFGIWHMLLAFFTQLNGFAGLPFLNDRYLLAIVIGFAALLVMGLVTAIVALGAKWQITRPKPVAVIGYVLLLTVSLHALMLGNHFVDLLGIIPQIFVAALAILLILLSVWFDRYLARRYATDVKLGLLTTSAIAFVAVIVVLQFAVPGVAIINVHADHGTGTDTSTGLAIPQPAAPSAGQVSKIAGGYNVTLYHASGSKKLQIELQRIDAPTPELVGQAKLLLVNEVTFDTLTADATLDPAVTDRLSFKFDLDQPSFVSGVYEIYAKFYLATGGVQTSFSTTID